MKLKNGKQINIFIDPESTESLILFTENIKKPSVERNRDNEKPKKKKKTELKTIINKLLNEII
tara:strand:- start:194 stop:382 length:189 start_codon:yes stop_codon:yes gene_type:complete